MRLAKRQNFTEVQKLAIAERAGWHCQKCTRKIGAGEGRVDHIKRSVDDGPATLENGQLLCQWCHDEKTARENSEQAKADRAASRHFLGRKKSRWR